MEDSNKVINVTCCFSKILVIIFTMLWAELNMAGVRDQYVFCLNYSTLLHTVCFSMLKTQEHCCLCFKPLVHYYEYYDVLLIKIRNHKLYSIQHLPQSDALKRCVQKSFYTPKHFDSATLVTLQHSDITSAWLKLAHAHKQLRINHLQMCEDCEPLQDGNVRWAGMG